MFNIIRRITSIFYDKRSDHRYALIGSIPGEISNQEGAPFVVHPIDISRRGLGILIDPAPQIGEELKYSCNDLPEDLTFIVRHIETPDIAVEQLKRMRRCGLECHSEDNVLQTLAKAPSLMIQE